MLIKKVSYMDYNGNGCEDILYFNMTKDEVISMQVKMDGKFIDHLQSLVAGEHIEELYSVFRNLVLDGYGERSADGKHFYKTPKAREEFSYSIAFSELMNELLTGDKEGISSFVRAMLPPDFQQIQASLPEN